MIWSRSGSNLTRTGSGYDPAAKNRIKTEVGSAQNWRIQIRNSIWRNLAKSIRWGVFRSRWDKSGANPFTGTDVLSFLSLYSAKVLTIVGLSHHTTGWPRSYRIYQLQITQPSQYGSAKLQYRFAVISGSPSTIYSSTLNRNSCRKCKYTHLYQMK